MQGTSINLKLASLNILFLLTSFVSPYARAGFSEKWGYVSVSTFILILAVGLGIGGLRAVYEHFFPPKESEFDNNFYWLTRDAELHHKAIATEEENIEKWAGGHIGRRVVFLLRYIKPLVDQGLVELQQAVKKEDLVLITRYYDLVHASSGDTYSKQRADEVEIKRYLKQQSESELQSFTLEKLIHSYFLNQTIGAPKEDRAWADICEQYNNGTVRSEHQ